MKELSKFQLLQYKNTSSNHDCLHSPDHVISPPLKVKNKTKQKLRMEENYFESKKKTGKILKKFASIEKLRRKIISAQEFSTNLHQFLPSVQLWADKPHKLKLTSKPCKSEVFSPTRVDIFHLKR